MVNLAMNFLRIRRSALLLTNPLFQLMISVKGIYVVLVLNFRNHMELSNILATAVSAKSRSSCGVDPPSGLQTVVGFGSRSCSSSCNRKIPSHHINSFDFKIVSQDACGGHSCFVLNNCNLSNRHDPEIQIKGTTAVEIASGLHWYLKYWFSGHVSLKGTDSTTSPAELLSKCCYIQLVRRSQPYPCLVVYTEIHLWWDWERCQKEID
ncbi:hypothetical protein EV1_028309 [Malus domestica]